MVHLYSSLRLINECFILYFFHKIFVIFILNIICYFISSSSTSIVLLRKMHCSVSVCSTSFSVICKACWVVMISFHFYFSWKSLFHLCLRTRVSWSKIVWVDWFSFFQTFGYITLFSPALQGFHENFSQHYGTFLNVNWSFSLPNFRTFSLCFTFQSLIIRCPCVGIFRSCQLGFYELPVCGYPYVAPKRGSLLAFFHWLSCLSQSFLNTPSGIPKTYPLGSSVESHRSLTLFSFLLFFFF